MLLCSECWARFAHRIIFYAFPYLPECRHKERKHLPRFVRPLPTRDLSRERRHGGKQRVSTIHHRHRKRRPAQNTLGVDHRRLGNRSDIKRFRWVVPHRVILALGTHQALEPMQRRKCEQLASGTNCLLEVAECIGLQHLRSASQEEPQGEMALNYIEDSFCTNKRRKDPQSIHRPQFSPAYLIFLYFTSGLGLLERKTLMIHLNP